MTLNDSLTEVMDFVSTFWVEGLSKCHLSFSISDFDLYGFRGGLLVDC